MATKSDFSPADWNTLRDTPYLVGFATLMAGSSGVGTIKELFAISRGMVENLTSNIALVRDLSAPAEIEAARTSLKQSFSGAENKPSPERVRQHAIQSAQSSMAILSKTASKEESEAYARMLYGIAEKVASAAREGGFLGFGGTLVSEGEKAFLDELRSTLGLEMVKRA